MSVDPHRIYAMARALAEDVQTFVGRYAEEWDGGDKGYLGAELHGRAEELLDAMESDAGAEE